MRTAAILPALALVALIAPPAQAELSDADRIEIQRLVEEFRQGVVTHDKARLEATLGPGMPSARKAELLKTVGEATDGYEVNYTLQVGPDDIKETGPGRAQVSTSYSIQARRGSSHWNVNGMTASFTFELVEVDGKKQWKIAATDADSLMGMGG